MPIAKEISNMLDISHKPFHTFQSIPSPSIDLNRKEKVFLLCDGFTLFLLMAINAPIARNHRSVGTPLQVGIQHAICFIFIR